MVISEKVADRVVGADRHCTSVTDKDVSRAPLKQTLELGVYGYETLVISSGPGTEISSNTPFSWSWTPGTPAPAAQVSLTHASPIESDSFPSDMQTLGDPSHCP